VCTDRQYENSFITKSQSNLFISKFSFISEGLISRGEYAPVGQRDPGHPKKMTNYIWKGVRGGAVIEALRYKPEGRGIDSRSCQ
jgi:hypothetical protein